MENSNTAPIETRKLLRRMREGKYNVNENDNKPKKDLSIRDMLKITRMLNEDDVKEKSVEKKTIYDQEREEQKFRSFFSDMNVNIEFVDLEVYDDLIFWGGTVDGVIQFVYIVTPERKDIQFNYLEDFSAENPENEKIIEKIESYFDSFYKYWRDNVFQKT